MSDILKGDTFVDGQSVTGARLNNLVDNAVIQPSFVSGKSSVTPAAGDGVLLYQVSSGQLRRATVGAVGGSGTVSSVGLALPAGIFSVSGSPVVTTGTLTGTLANQSGNKVLASPEDGSSGPPTFRALGPADVPVGSVVLSGTQIDWSLAPTFIKTISVNTIFTFLNNVSGRTIRVYTSRPTGVFTITWPSAGVLWPGGSPPAITQVMFWEFTMIGASIFSRGTSMS